MAYAVAAMLVYPVGVLALFSWLLYKERAILAKPGEEEVVALKKKYEQKGLIVPETALVPRTEAEERRVRHLAFLTESYAARYWWFEVLELVRKLCQTSLVVFLFSGTSGQMVLTMLICIVAAQLLSSFAPYLDHSDGRLAVVMQWSLFLVAFTALLHKVDVADELPDSQNVFSALLYGVTLGAPSITLAAYLLEARLELRRTTRGDDAPKELELAVTPNPAFSRQGSLRPGIWREQHTEGVKKARLSQL